MSRPGNSVGLGLKLKATQLVCFSDLDGTLIHYPKEQDRWGEVTGVSVQPGCILWVDRETGKRHKLLQLPPSSTGQQGVISCKSLTHLASMRSSGVLLVLVTGARTSTLLQRLPYLPAADAYASENGGRLFFPSSSLPVAMPLSEDLEWRARHDQAAGAACQEGKPPEQKQGLLWQCYRSLIAADFVIDTYSYSTAFRVRLDKSDKSEAQLLEVLEAQAKGLTWTTNFGHWDVYPSTSGKRALAEYILERANTTPSMSFLLCDDANDMDLADLVPKVFLPSVAAESVREHIGNHPSKFVLADKSGTLGTEETLVNVDDYIGTFVLG